jgi:hypothetical protein
MVVNLPILSPLWALDAWAFLPVVYMVGAFLLGAVVIALVQRWRRRSTSLGPSASEQLAQFRSLYEQGAISEEEYRRLRTILGEELRRAIDLPPHPPAPVSPPAQQIMPAPADKPPVLEQAPPPPADKPPTDGDPPPAPGIRPA